MFNNSIKKILGLALANLMLVSVGWAKSKSLTQIATETCNEAGSTVKIQGQYVYLPTGMNTPTKLNKECMSAIINAIGSPGDMIDFVGFKRKVVSDNVVIQVPELNICILGIDLSMDSGFGRTKAESKVRDHFARAESAHQFSSVFSDVFNSSAETSSVSRLNEQSSSAGSSSGTVSASVSATDGAGTSSIDARSKMNGTESGAGSSVVNTANGTSDSRSTTSDTTIVSRTSLSGVRITTYFDSYSEFPLRYIDAANKYAALGCKTYE